LLSKDEAQRIAANIANAGATALKLARALFALADQKQRQPHDVQTQPPPPQPTFEPAFQPPPQPAPQPGPQPPPQPTPQPPPQPTPQPPPQAVGATPGPQPPAAGDGLTIMTVVGDEDHCADAVVGSEKTTAAASNAGRALVISMTSNSNQHPSNPITALKLQSHHTAPALPLASSPSNKSLILVNRPCPTYIRTRRGGSRQISPSCRSYCGEHTVFKRMSGYLQHANLTRYNALS